MLKAKQFEPTTWSNEDGRSHRVTRQRSKQGGADRKVLVQNAVSPARLVVDINQNPAPLFVVPVESGDNSTLGDDGFPLPEGRQQSVVEVAFHTWTKLLQRHFCTVDEAHAIVMRTLLQVSDGNILICRHALGSLDSLGDVFEPQFGVIGHADGG